MEGMFKVCFPLVMVYLDIHNEAAVLRLSSFLVTLHLLPWYRVARLIRSLFRKSSLLCTFMECHENSLDIVVPCRKSC